MRAREKERSAKQRPNGKARSAGLLAKPAAASGAIEAKSRRDFRIVGIGASAGGLSAVGELLRHLPVNTGMGFVVVQHLDPDHKSELTRLLRKVSQLPVEEVAASIRVQPNRVYVIPPDHSLSFENGVLMLKPRAKPPAVYRAIDSFLESLATDCGARAVGVVLSGTGNDGTVGLEAIKAADGVTFAQDNSAKYASMPQSAADAGCVDHVLSPAALARALGRLGSEPIERGSPLGKTEPAGVAALHRRIRQLLLKHCGVDFTSYKSSTFTRRIHRRMLLSKLSSMAEYVEHLEKNLPELERLFSDVLIHVTSFFRNPDSFEFLKVKVFSKLLTPQRTDAVRIWSLGCSSGEEAYSLAMTFIEAADKVRAPPPFQIFAADLNPAMIDHARKGLYSKDSVAGLSRQRLRRFFTEETGGYRINKALRDGVVFAHHNALRDPPFSRIDLVSCRNMLIYLEPGVQEKIFPTFHYALKPDGYLFLGSAESANSVPHLFESVHKKHRIFARRSGPSGQMLSGQRLPALQKRLASYPHRGDSPHGNIDILRESDRLTLNRFAPAGVLVDGAWHVLQFRGDTSPWLTAPPGKASFHVLKMARPGLEPALRNALQQSKKTADSVRVTGIRFGRPDENRTVDLEILPLRNTKERCTLIFFIEPNSTLPAAKRIKAPPPLRGNDSSEQVAALTRELDETRDYLQSFQQQSEATNEELQTSNEEATSANEELQSVNEELETSKEEIESANEELITVNEEMTSRNLDLTQLNTDLVNLQAATHLAIVLLGRDRQVRRFTEEAGRQFNLLSTDVGRSFDHARHSLDVPQLDDLIRGVIDEVKSYEQEVQNKEGRWFLLRIRPYLTLEKRIDGAVLVLVDIEALKRSEQAAKEALVYAQSTVDTVLTPILVLNGELKVVSANRAFYQLFDLSPSTAVGRPFQKLGGGPWAGAKLRALMESILPNQSAFRDHELEHEFKHLGRRILLLSANRIVHPANHSEHILLGVEDVTQRRFDETELHENRERFARIFNQTAAGVAQTDRYGQFTLVNDRFCQIVDRTRKELLAVRMQAITYQEDLPKNATLFQDLISGKILDFSAEKRYIRPDGSLIWVHNEVAAIRDADGEVQSVAAIVTDISGRRQNEAALSYQASMLHTMSEAAAQLLTTDSPQSAFDDVFGRLIHVIGAEFYFLHLISADGKKLILRNSHGLDAEQRTSLAEFPYEVTAGEEPVGLSFCAEQEKIAGKNLNARAFVCYPLGIGTRFLGALCVALAKREKFEVTELRFIHAICDLVATGIERARLTQESLVAREIAEHANTAKDAFLAALSHELRTPLSPMLLLAGAGARDPALSTAARRDFAAIEKNALLEARLIDDLLDLTRITHGKLALQTSRVNVQQIVEDAIETVRPEIEAKNQTIERRFQSLEPIVLGDPVRLQQIFWNILRNAMKFTPTGGTIAIETTLQGQDRIEIRFVDTGMGMTPRELSRVFDAFSQGDHAGPAGSHRFGGIGLGLAISRTLTELHHGTLRAESAGLGAGSRFIVDLPIALKKSSRAAGLVKRLSGNATPRSATSLPAIGSLSILLVEDHEPTRNALARLLTRRGHEVTAAGSLADARRAVELRKFDVLVSDIGLPDGSGNDLMIEMRDRFRMKGIALTGYGMDSDLVRTKDSGFSCHLTKPVSLAALEKALARAAL